MSFNNWTEHKFSELCDITRGGSPRPIHDFISNTGMPWIKIADATRSNSRYITETKEYIKLEGIRSSVEVGPGDLILSNSATPGLPKFVQIKACIHDGWMLLRNFKNLDKNFAYWLLLYERKNLISKGSGSVFINLNTDILKNHVVKIPPLNEQIKIAEQLDIIAEKLELNGQINQTLEHIAQAIFKSWFVEFEPVKAKINAKHNNRDPHSATICAITGKTNEELKQINDEQLQKLTATAALFPDEFEKSELGEIPKGWGVSNIGNEFNATMGQSPPGDTYNEVGEGMPFFQGRRDFGWRYPTNRVYCTAPKRLAKAGDTLLSVRAPVGDVNKSTSDCCIGRGVAALRHRTGCEAYTYYSMQRLEQHFNNFDSQGTVFGSINQKDLKAIKILKPSGKALKAFTEIVECIDEQIRIIEEQMSSLSSIRNSLLPKLLSGKLQISN